MLGNLWRSLVAGRKPVKMRKPAQGLFGRATLGVEVLEDRCLMTAAIAEYPVPSGNSPFGITSGPDGNVWFTEKAGQIAMMNPTTHAITEFAIPTSGGTPTGITAGPDGNIWFTESSANQIGMLNTSTDVITEFPIPGSNPTAITAGPDGNLWFTETGSNQIGSINPTNKAISQYTIPTGGSSPTGITAGAINPFTHTFTEYVIPQASSQPNGITAGSDGNIWFTESNANRIGQVSTTTHVITSFLIAGPGEPRSIAAAADGNLWFTEVGTNQIGTLTLPGDTISLMTIPTAATSPAWISVGPGGTLWFAESATSQVGEIVAPTTISTAPTNQTIVAGQTATFTASAIGFPTPTVIWQVSTNGGATYTPIINGGVYSATTSTSTSGVTTDTLTITAAPITMTGYVYEAVFTNGISPFPSVATAPVTLTVNNVLSVGAPPAQGVINTPYNQTVSIVGSTSPFTLFAVNNFNAGGTGLTVGDITTNTINGTLTVSGTPSGVGIASFTISVANTAGNSLTQNLNILINPPLSIATTTLPQATVGTAYNQSIAVVGGAMPYMTFNVTNFNGGTTGLTPANITTNAAIGTFAINVIPASAGTVTFTVNVSDSAGTVATKSFTILVNPALAITPSLPQGTALTNYNQTLTVTGGGVPYALTVTGFSAGTTGLTSGSITTNATAGTFTINGTPLAAGAFTFTAAVTDSIGAVLNKTYTVTINPALTITPTLPQGTAGASYLHTITVAGGSTPYTTFTVTGFSAGTTGLSAAAVTVNAANNTVVVSGTPTTAGTLAFTVNVSDSAGASLTRAYSITINPPLIVGSLSTTQWTAGAAAFPGTMTIGGGTTPVTISSTSGLPTGLALTLVGSTLSFTGTPSAASVFSAGSVTLHDAAGASITKTFSITINAAPTISSLTASQWTTGRYNFNGAMTTAGGTGGLSIFATTGLPTGLALGLTGSTLSFTGAPSVVGTFAGSVTLSDAIGAKVTRTFSITINAVPTIAALTTTQWTAGKAGFTGTMAIVAGTTPHVITAQSGMPPGLTAVVVGTSIQFTGTPTTAGTFSSCSITIVDAAGATVTKTFSITINPPVLIVTTSVAPSTMGVLYKTTLQTTGGTGAITFKVSSGSLPPGYAVSSSGAITGLSRGVGSFTFTVTATDAVGASVSKTYTLVVN
jgi:streptogramin lyase